MQPLNLYEFAELFYMIVEIASPYVVTIFSMMISFVVIRQLKVITTSHVS